MSAGISLFVPSSGFIFRPFILDMPKKNAVIMIMVLGMLLKYNIIHNTLLLFLIAILVCAICGVGTTEIGHALMYAVYDNSGGEGDWAILTSTSQATNQSSRIEAMKEVMKERLMDTSPRA